MQFDPVQVTHRRLPGNCNGRPSIVEHGYFRGTIELHGEREFMSVDRRSAPGRLVHSLRRVCKSDQSVSGLSFERRGRRKSAGFTLLTASRESPVLGFTTGLLKFGPGPPEPFFYAQRFRFREGMIVFTSVYADGDPEDFVISAPGKPKVAEVAPPAPFEGSATFTLTSPKKSTWEGDLAVALPGVGRVPLAGPKFLSELCEGAHCTGSAENHILQVAGSAR